MIISTYSYRPFPLEMRTDFELPAWPYNDEHFDLFAEYMKSLYVFRYEDSEMEDGRKFIGYPINFEREGLTFPFTAFYNQVAVSNSELKVVGWPLDKADNSELLKQIDANPIQKDRMAWFSWNIPVSIQQWDTNMIKREILHQYVDSSCKEGKCFEQTKLQDALTVEKIEKD